MDVRVYQYRNVALLPRTIRALDKLKREGLLRSYDAVIWLLILKAAGSWKKK